MKSLIFRKPKNKKIIIANEEFILKPLTWADLAKIYIHVKSRTERDYHVILKSLVSWSLKDESGQPLPITIANIKLLDVFIFTTLLRTITVFNAKLLRNILEVSEKLRTIKEV